jgi:hypothetical protein
MAAAWLPRHPGNATHPHRPADLRLQGLDHIRGINHPAYRRAERNEQDHLVPISATPRFLRFKVIFQTAIQHPLPKRLLQVVNQAALGE